MTFYSGTHDPSVKPSIEIRFYNSSNVEIGTPAIHTITTDIDVTGSLGGPYTLSATAPTGVSYLKVIFRDPSTTKAGAKGDALCLRLATPIPTGTPTRTGTTTPTPTRTATATATATSTATPTPPCAVATGGTYIDAETYTSGSNLGATYFFAGVKSSLAGYVGTGYLQTGTTQNQLDFSDVNTNPGNYERYNYRLTFPTAGTYKVWIRGWAPSSNENSVTIGVDGTAVGALTENTFTTWVWTNTLYNASGANTITISTPGVHTINVWPREANHLLDGIYLTTTSTVPTGGTPSGAKVCKGS